MSEICHDIPFVENPGGQCVPACIAMVVQHFRPELDFDLAESSELCGYEAGQGAWGIQSLLSLSDLGFEVQWVEDWDIHQFIENPEGYLAEIFDDQEMLDYQLEHSNIPLERERAIAYVENKQPFEKRPGTRHDVETLIDDGWLMRLEVNGKPLANQEGYGAHSVLAIGYNNDEVIIHNPDGKYGPKPNQHVEWERFMDAWRGFGGSLALNAYRMKL